MFVHFLNRYCPVCRRDLATGSNWVQSGHFKFTQSDPACIVGLRGTIASAIYCKPCQSSMPESEQGGCFGELKIEYGLMVGVEDDKAGTFVPVADDKGRPVL